MTNDMRYGSSILFIPLLALVACGGGPPAGTEEAKAAGISEAAQAQQRVRAMEDSLSDMALFDRRRLMALRDVYAAYVQRFPLDSLAPDMLRKAAATSGDLGEHEKAVMLYDRLIKDYPQWPRTQDACYFRAFEIDNGLKKKGEAKQAYEEFIAKYPDNQFADDAKKMIEYMQYSDEELMEKFRKMNPDTTTAGTKKAK
jgi:outer membrane protein assembly factor BamD (BamD/ComL family)